MKQTTKAQVLAPLALSVLVPFTALGFAACKKDEPPPPLPSATAPSTAAPSAPIELVPEELPVASASASATAPKGTGSSSSLKKCCAALTQNAQSAPEPNKTYMLQAAAVCNGAAAAGQASGAAMGAVNAALRGAGLPAGCR